MRWFLWSWWIGIVYACINCDDSHPCTVDTCHDQVCEHSWNCTATQHCVLHLEQNEQGTLLKPWEPCMGQTFSNCTSIQVVLSRRKYITLSKEEETATPCNPNPCAGDCEIHLNTFKCKCSPGQYGERCFDTLYTLSTSVLLTYSVGIALFVALCLLTCLSCTNACLPVKTVFKKIITPAANNATPATRPLRF